MSEENKSYKQILKSTGIFGGSQVVTIIIGILRNKILAILLGTVGIGLIGMYQTILELVKSLSAFGVETTGVREIASANDGCNDNKLLETISLIDRLSLILAILGAFCCVLFSYPISVWAFDDSSYVLQISFLSISIFFSILAAGQTIVLHGLRQISYMVKSTIISSSLGLILSLPLYYFFRMDGVVPAFIVLSLVMYLVALYYRKQVKVEVIHLPFEMVLDRGGAMLRTGFFIVISSVITTAGYFLIRAFLSRDLGLNSVGLFQAAWSITSVYLILVLKSMGSDFYPRLCSIISEKDKTNKLINEQTYIVLIVSVPLIILLFLCSKFALTLLYSSEFSDAVRVLNWQVLGTFLKVLSWPLGFILLAKGKGFLFFLSELIFMVVYLVATYFLYQVFNFEAVGVAYLLAYLVYLLVVYVLSIKLSEFSWTQENLKIGFVNLILVLLAFYLTQYYREYIIIAGIPLFVISLIYSFVKLNKVLPVKSIMSFFIKK